VIFTELALRGAFIVDMEPRKDDRGPLPGHFAGRSFPGTA
jgi:hypothetical protein